LSDSYLKELIAAFPQDVTVYNLTIDGKLATAAACCVMQKERYAIWIGGVNARRDLSVNDYLVWEFIKQAKSEGFKKLDLGALDERLSRYKAKFDPVLEPFCYVGKSDTLRKKTVFFAKRKLKALRS
ncbi:MAG: GNAT family N-acetyltransferase, partial [Halobacteriota archaeon]